MSRREVEVNNGKIKIILADEDLEPCDKCPMAEVCRKIPIDEECDLRNWCIGEAGGSEFPVDILDSQGQSIFLRYSRPRKVKK